VYVNTHIQGALRQCIKCALHVIYLNFDRRNSNVHTAQTHTHTHKHLTLSHTHILIVIHTDTNDERHALSLLIVNRGAKVLTVFALTLTAQFCGPPFAIVLCKYLN